MAISNLSQRTVTAYLKQILGPRKNVKIPMYDCGMIIGRSKKADIVSSDPNVSRTHCILKYSPTGWSVKDLGSVNGTYVNNTRISNDSYFLLSDGDEIYFGPRSDAPEAYMFESVKTSNQSSSQGNPARKVLRNKTPSPQKPAVKRKVSHKNSDGSDKDTAIVKFAAGGTINTNSVAHPTDQEHIEDGYHSESSVSSCESLRTRINKLNNNAHKKRQKKRKFYSSSENLAVPSTSSEKPMRQSPTFNFNRINFLGEKSDDEDSESLLHQEVHDKGNIDYEDDKVLSPIEVTSIDTKSCDSNSSVVKAMSKELLDVKKRNAILEQSLSIMADAKAKSDEALKNKENSELDIEQRANMRKDEAFKSLLEDELICNICTELYIKPVILNCCHTFCQYCINEWKKKKKQCPICRERIETQSLVLFLEDYINKAVKMVDPGNVQKRAELLKKREETQQKKTPKRKRYRNNNSRRRNAISGPSGRTNTTVDTDEVQALRDQLVHIQSNSDDIQAYVDIIDDLIQDDYIDSDDAYGRIMDARHHFGPCYNCGRTGHWANECPHN